MIKRLLWEFSLFGKYMWTGEYNHNNESNSAITKSKYSGSNKAN